MTDGCCIADSGQTVVLGLPELNALPERLASAGERNKQEIGGVRMDLTPYLPQGGDFAFDEALPGSQNTNPTRAASEINSSSASFAGSFAWIRLRTVFGSLKIAAFLGTLSSKNASFEIAPLPRLTDLSVSMQSMMFVTL